MRRRRLAPSQIRATRQSNSLVSGLRSPAMRACALLRAPPLQFGCRLEWRRKRREGTGHTGTRDVQAWGRPTPTRPSSANSDGCALDRHSDAPFISSFPTLYYYHLKRRVLSIALMQSARCPVAHELLLFPGSALTCTCIGAIQLTEAIGRNRKAAMLSAHSLWPDRPAMLMRCIPPDCSAPRVMTPSVRVGGASDAGGLCRRSGQDRMVHACRRAARYASAIQDLQEASNPDKAK
ncbi:hypothetical protein B0H10DRAFT_632765 [Mycena sp. CBHHK59/15]|nr:hypothetical protein B0H10DRAFT_632765 [Mycena sp. CBHHK59/15]